jgi:tetratricopeptide (TPR) repeat protein
MILLYAGRYAEAEQVLREYVASAKNLSSIYQSNSLNNLGYPLLLQGRYDEAMRCFEGAIEIHPESPNAYTSLADVYLYQGIEADRAFDLVNYATQLQTKARRGVQSIHWATGAWALAQMGHFDEAAESLQAARAEINPDHKPLLAELEYISGQFHRLAGRPEEAKVHFNEVLAIDSQGMWRDRAERALRNMSGVGEPNA